MIEHDPVNPDHYNGDACMRAIAKRGNGRAFCIETAVKYLWRAGRKPGEKRGVDVAKAYWYLTWWYDHGPEYDASYEPQHDAMIKALDELADKTLDPQFDPRPALTELEDRHGN